MRRKSEKGKEKESPEKKSVRRTSRRHSKRRRHSRSSSPEPVDSDAENNVTLRKSSRVKDSNEKSKDDKDCNNSTEISKTDKKEVVTSVEISLEGGEEDWREDTAFWSEGTSKDVSGSDKTEESSLKLPNLQEVITSDNVQSVTEKEKEDAFEPKGKRPKRTRKRSNASGCEDKEAAANRSVCDDSIQSDDTATSAAKKEVRRKTKSGYDSDTELQSGKRNNGNSDNVEENNLPKENFSQSTEMKSSETDVPPTASRETTEDILEMKPSIEKPNVPMTPESEESLAEHNSTEKAEQEEGNVEKFSDSLCATPEIESDKNLPVDVSEDVSVKNEEHPVNDSPSDQDDTRLGSYRDTSEESVTQRDIYEGESNTSTATSEVLSKAAAPRRSRSSDSPDLQVRIEETQDSLEELEKCVSSDESKEKRKSPSDKKPAKRRSMSDDSTKDSFSNNDKHGSDFKAQKTDRHRERSREAESTSAKSECESDRTKHEEEKEKTKRIKLCRTSRDSVGQSSSERVSGGHSPEAHEHRRPTKLKRPSRSPGSSNKPRHSESDVQEAGSPPYRHERILLRRSFSDKTATRSENEACDETQTSTKDDVQDKENGNLSTSTGLSTAGSISRKRRWGASKSSRVTKKPVLSISSDSLKNLIPGAQPLPAAEVQLTEDDNCKEVKLELEESWSVKVEEKEKVLMGPVVMLPEVSKVPPTDDHSRFSMRKISIVSDDARKLQRSPSPPKHKVSNILFITNLVRPFTVNQLKELLARTGTIVENGFWIDKIKSKCFVQYETEEQARDTRNALHGVRWPVSNPKQLCVDFGEREAMEAAKTAGDTDTVPRKVEPAQLERVPSEPTTVLGANAPLVEDWAAAQQVRAKEREKERERERARAKEKPGMPALAAQAPDQRVQKMPPAVREWDLGKLGQFSPEEEGRREDRIKEKERKVRKDKMLRSRSTSPADLLARPKKRMVEGPPSKLLDDLFRKTKTTPCIYWLPLTAEQIVVKEEIRRKHVAEHERRVAEMRKAEERERERERARVQQRPRHRSDRDRERERDRRSGRRRSGSGSPKK